MCRFALYLGPDILLSALVTEPKNSIIHQSIHSHFRKEPLNGDGFGVAWYVPELRPHPAVFKSISPAWSDRNLASLAPVTKSGCILAHVRAATPGLPVVSLNCHPFVNGPFAFMHNGSIGGYGKLRRKILARLSDEAFASIQGSTDSEHLFALFLDHHRASQIEDDTERMAAALTATITEIEELRRSAGIEEASLLNLAVADGKRAVVSRYISHTPEEANSLFVSTGGRYLCEDGICHMPDSPEGDRAVLVASEPLSEDHLWVMVGVNRLLLVQPNGGYEERALSA